MKVLEEKQFAYEFTCRKCGSKLVAEADDVGFAEFGSYGDYEYSFYVTCPVCDTDQRLKFSEVPPKVDKLARSKGAK